MTKEDIRRLRLTDIYKIPYWLSDDIIDFLIRWSIKQRQLKIISDYNKKNNFNFKLY